MKAYCKQADWSTIQANRKVSLQSASLSMPVPIPPVAPTPRLTLAKLASAPLKEKKNFTTKKFKC